MKLSPVESKLECQSQDLPKLITQSWSLSIRMQITRAPLWSLATVWSQSITLRLMEDIVFGVAVLLFTKSPCFLPREWRDWNQFHNVYVYFSCILKQPPELSICFNLYWSAKAVMAMVTDFPQTCILLV